jgi:hypothetical protein
LDDVDKLTDREIQKRRAAAAAARKLTPEEMPMPEWWQV